MRRKLLFGLAIVVLLAGLGLLLGQKWIAQRAFDRAIDSTVGVDQSARLGDGLHAYVCGSGSPMPDAQRAGPCIGVLAGKQAFVFDSGSGSIRKLQRMGFPMDRLQAAFLTHLHSDHIDGLGELLLQAWVAGGRIEPLPVYGPLGTEYVLEGLREAYEIDQRFRVAHHGPNVVTPSGFGGTPMLIEVPVHPPRPDGARHTNQAKIYAEDGVTITAIEVNHQPIAPAFGFRIDYKGRSIVISGDTVYSPNLVAAAKGADLMFHEALNKRMVAALGAKLAQRGQTRTAQIMTDIQNYHASPEDAARAAKEAGVKSLVLYHLVPAPPARLIEPLFLGDAPGIFPGVKLAHDGMIASLPADGSDVRFSEGF